MADPAAVDSDNNLTDTFVPRHIGPSDADLREMLAVVGCTSLDELMDQTVPESIRLRRALDLGPSRSEREAQDELRVIAGRNRVLRSMIGMGYYDTITPPVIQRNILENPGWYTQYTPYQAEISQGRLEALLNFQTMVADLTALPVANASLLDEATAAAEAMYMCRALSRDEAQRTVFFVADDCHPQTINVVRTRAAPLGIEVIVGRVESLLRGQGADRLATMFGVLLQYPTTDGRIENYENFIERVHKAGVRAVVATDLLACTLIRPPGEFGADIAVGSAQRFGVPMGFGGPHAAFMSCRDEYMRLMPGRIIGVSRDAHGRPACRLAIQTREQHIRREKATSNICTAQVLLAIMASMYAVWHGPRGLRRIARRVHGLTRALAEAIRGEGRFKVVHSDFFDTIVIDRGDARAGTTIEGLRQAGYNARWISEGRFAISLDETTTPDDLQRIIVSMGHDEREWDFVEMAQKARVPTAFERQSRFLTHPVFNSYHSEHEMLRYIKRLENRDLSLAHSMIPLGSCTMKLNAAAEMLPITWPEFAGIHPFAPADQTQGYAVLFEQLRRWLAEITGLPAVSLQPNAGSQGEYAGLLAIRAYHESRGQKQRDVCLIPTSAHGTNPASATIAGYRVVPVACDSKGNIDPADLRAKAREHGEGLGAIMVTYPSTHGVFEESIGELCRIVHDHGGQVYMDGANMNAQVGLCRPGDIGADVCHLNLHKTFCIPHGGGGPGMGPIAVAAHLAEFLPGDPLANVAQPPSAVSEPHESSAASSASSLRVDGAQFPPTSTKRETARPSAKSAELAYRRDLPHINSEGRPVFVTFCTANRWVLPEEVRQRVLDHCLHDHGSKIHVHGAVVMPDHVHLVFTALKDSQGDTYGLAEIMNGIKGASSHTVNKLLRRRGAVWQPESFDRVLRSDESVYEKVEYICMNPVRKGLVEREDAYPWLWREWKEGKSASGMKAVVRGETQPGAAVPVPHSTQPGAAVPHLTQPGAAVLHSTQPGAAVPHVGAVSAAMFGSASILPISWMYIAMMGAEGLKRASQAAILNANYMAQRLMKHFAVLYTGTQRRVAHEFIVDCRPFEKSAGVRVEDIAKRLMDYGFHAPTMSFPVPGTLMIEPTESESRAELDRFCDALIAIREEIRAIEEGRADRNDNPLKHAPHTAEAVSSDEWPHRYSRAAAAFPLPWVRERKFWPAVGRIDNVYGDRHLVCTCEGMEAYGR
ncbi:MAG: aminomethyl-transferring glycine dehydrogenase [Phycisphaerae bacterium]|nr:aminomethyl-transferring glycine dehydrogenase [Phycisphaerae bacterium]